MATFELSTVIRAPRERVFDLARSIDAHVESTAQTRERAVGGVTSGLIGPGEEVTWEARHLGVKQRLTSRISAYDRPQHFQDVMVRGAFAEMVHDHRFDEHEQGTLLRDRFSFRSPFGPLGWCIDQLYLARYMRRFLERRNLVLKQLAESDDWRRFLPEGHG